MFCYARSIPVACVVRWSPRVNWPWHWELSLSLSLSLSLLEMRLNSIRCWDFLNITLGCEASPPCLCGPVSRETSLLPTRVRAWHIQCLCLDPRRCVIAVVMHWGRATRFARPAVQLVPTLASIRKQLLHTRVRGCVMWSPRVNWPWQANTEHLSLSRRGPPGDEVKLYPVLGFP